jgi:ATP-dependent transcriptional regulator
MTDSEHTIDERVSELETHTILSKRQAQVQALSEQGASRDEIATELGISVGTVDSHRGRVAKKLHAARRTVEKVALP